MADKINSLNVLTLFFTAFAYYFPMNAKWMLYTSIA
jgi:hypothetical protein